MKRMNRTKKTKLIFLTVLVLIISFTAVAKADPTHYSILGFPAAKFTTNQYSLTYKYTQSGSYIWTSYVNEGISAWNYSPAPIWVSQTTGTPNISITSNNYGNTGWHGNCQYPNWLTWRDKAFIKLNDYYLDEIEDNRAELVSHEVGHAFILADYDPAYLTLMRSSGYNGSATPTDSDVAGVDVTY